MMWFDVQAALAEVEDSETELPSRVAHVAHVARTPGSKSEKRGDACESGEMAVIAAVRGGKRRPGAIATATGMGASVTYALLDRLLARGRLVMSRDGEWRLASLIGREREINGSTRLWPLK